MTSTFYPLVIAMESLRFRSIWISDVHLGLADCKAEFLVRFLEATESDYLYLVGDIIDLHNMKNGWYWPQTHTSVIQKLLAKARNGTRVVYIPGNHDEALRQYAGKLLGPITITLQAIHRTADGRRLLILHGDEFDVLIKHNVLLISLGSRFYELLLWLNRLLNRVRGILGYPYWSLSAHLKTKVKRAILYMDRFEAVAAHEAARCAVDGLVCGHIHKAAIRRVNQVLYCNDGDWVESCTALVERHDGSLELLDWLKIKPAL